MSLDENPSGLECCTVDRLEHYVRVGGQLERRVGTAGDHILQRTLVVADLEAGELEAMGGGDHHDAVLWTNLSPLDHSDIVNPEFLKRVKGGSFEMAAVAAGAQLELSAINYYKEAADNCPDEESAKVFRFLAEWEADHLEHLNTLESRLKDEYFADLGFSPM